MITLASPLMSNLLHRHVTCLRNKMSETKFSLHYPVMHGEPNQIFSRKQANWIPAEAGMAYFP